MKKLLLIIAFLPLMAKSQTIVIDSIIPGTISSTITGVYISTPWYVSTGTKAKVYMHSTGTFTPNTVINLGINSVTQVFGTYQKLVDSNFVWPITVNACSNSAAAFLPVSVYYGANVNYMSNKCLSTEIPELSKEQIPIKTEYYNILGQPTKEGDLLIKVEYFENGDIRKSKLFNFN